MCSLGAGLVSYVPAKPMLTATRARGTVETNENIKRYAAEHSKQRQGRPAPTGNPAFSIAAAAVGVVGLVCGAAISWMFCIVMGIAAMALGVIARRKNAKLPWLATVGIVLGVICIVSSLALVAIVSFQLIRLGVL